MPPSTCWRRRAELVRAFVFIGGLLVLALLGALIAPYFVDWTAYRSDFEREASRILGRRVEVRGGASATLLPFPSLTFGDVAVLGDDGKPLLEIDHFRMDAELAPYLSGEILIYSMTLQSPTIRVPVHKDGSIGWVVDRPNVPSDAKVVLENVAISDGRVILEDARRRPQPGASPHRRHAFGRFPGRAGRRHRKLHRERPPDRLLPVDGDDAGGRLAAAAHRGDQRRTDQPAGARRLRQDRRRAAGVHRHGKPAAAAAGQSGGRAAEERRRPVPVARRQGERRGTRRRRSRSRAPRDRR